MIGRANVSAWREERFGINDARQNDWREKICRRHTLCFNTFTENKGGSSSSLEVFGRNDGNTNRPSSRYPEAWRDSCESHDSSI